jgi:hypothetical protein
MRCRGHRLIAAAVLSAHCVVGTALAHGPEQKPERELVRLQGHRENASAEAEARAVVVLRILGKDLRFRLTARETFQLSDRSAEMDAKDHWTLQGEREPLARIAAARPDQRITILADHRPGSSDLFLLAVDLCPPE